MRPSASVDYAQRDGIIAGSPATEKSAIYVNRRWAGGQPPVVYCAGWGAGALNARGWWACELLAKEGLAVGCADLGDRTAGWPGPTGPGVWGNPTTVTRLSNLVTHMRTQLGCSDDPVVLMAASHGMAAASAWAAANPADTACLVAAIGTCDVEDIRANNRNGYAASIEAAYGGNTTWQAARPTHNPVECAPAFSAVPVTLWHSTDDPICLASTQTAFATAHGNTTLHSLGAVSHTLIGLDPAAVADAVLDALTAE